MAKVDFSSSDKADVDVPYYVGKKNKKFGFSHMGSMDKLLLRRYEIYPFGKTDYISGLFLAPGDIIVKLPAPTKRHVTFDYVGYSGGGGDLKVRGFNADGKFIGYCLLPRLAEASLRRASLELPGVKFLYFQDRLEYLLVSLYLDETPKRKLTDIREINEWSVSLDRRLKPLRGSVGRAQRQTSRRQSRR